MEKSTEVLRTGETKIRRPEKLIDMVLIGEYPAHNFLYINLRYETRRVWVEKIRDLLLEPLDPETLKIDPDVRRSRYLVIGHCLDKGETRRFYLGSFRNWSLHKPTPEVLFPERCIAAVAEGRTYYYSSPDQCMYMAESRAEFGHKLYPVSRATFLANSKRVER